YANVYMYVTLQTAIQKQLKPPYNNIPFDIRQVYYPRSLDERLIGSGSSASASLYQFNQIQQNAQDDETADESEF
ncbi:1011_t:CDS:2, partial [Funneliformis geosporum]